MKDFAKLIGAMLMAPFAVGGLAFLLGLEQLAKHYGAWGFWGAISTLLFPIIGFAHSVWGGLLGIAAWLAFWILAINFLQ